MDPEAIKKFKESGKIAATALQHGAKMIKPGVKLVDVCDAVENKIYELGGGCAFPTQTSRNDIAAHYCPEENDETVYEEGDVVKLDCGATVDGFVSDTALTVDLSGEKTDLINASKDALNAALKLVKPGTKISELGRAIQETIERHGFSPVRNLSGHGIGRYIVHQAPSIPNFDNGTSETLKEDMSIAIEPFASDGAGMIYEKGIPTVFMQQARKPIRNSFARDVLKTIESYHGLPFALKWLTRKHGNGKAKIGVRELLNSGIIKGYPSLPDVKGGLISQHEHSILVLDKPIIITKL